MKINYLLYSVAIASAFAACSDELAEVAVKAPANNALAGRPNVGEVVLSANAAQTRLTEDGTAFAQGDVVKLFLMDEFLPGTEEWNENMTPWKSQERWFTMYDMVDYIQTNYPYVNNGNGEFENPAAQLVEGNYVAYYQENQDYRYHDMTNRQDLWSYVNPKVVLDQKSANVYANMENDFYLDYQQFYRDDDATPDGKLVKEMELKPVMNRVHFIIGNLNNAQYRIRRISINRKDGDAVPTIAYVRPNSVRDWSDKVMNDNLADASLWENTNKFTCHKVEDSWVGGDIVEFHTYNGGKTSFSQTDARQITYFETTANGHIPYGLKGELSAPATEYAFEFPGEGHLLNAQAPFGATERVDVYLALPIFADNLFGDSYTPDFSEYEIRVDGDYRDITLGAAEDPGDWTPGYWEAPAIVTPNTKWKMEKAFDYNWHQSMGTSWPTGSLTVDFNDMILYKEAQYVTVHNSEELLLKLQADGEAKNLASYINLDGYGIEITDEVKAQILANEAAVKAMNDPSKVYKVFFNEIDEYNTDPIVDDLGYVVNGEQNTSDDTWTYGESAFGDEITYAENGMTNTTSCLVVKTKNFVSLDPVFETMSKISVTFAADQKIHHSLITEKKVVVAEGINVELSNGMTLSATNAQHVILLNGATVNLNNNAKILNVWVPQPNAVVTVNANTDWAQSKIAGLNNGKVKLPRTDVYIPHYDYWGNLEWKEWIGFNHNIDDLELNCTDKNEDAKGGVKYYEANGLETMTKHTGYFTAWSNLDHAGDYKIYNDAGTEKVKANDNKKPYVPTEPGVAPNY